MPNLEHAPVTPAQATVTPDVQAERAAYSVAAAAVLALRLDRPHLRVQLARVRPHPEIEYAQRAHPAALRTNRAFLEDTALTLLAGPAAQQIKYGELYDHAALDRAAALLREAARNDDEAESAPDYATVLLARARGELRGAWAEVEIVSMALREHGALDGTQIEHRVRCTQGIRGASLN